MDSVNFHFPLQFCNRLIHQFWKNINSGISWLSTSSAEPAFSKPCPLPLSIHRFCEDEEKREANQGWREASRAHLTWGPPHRGAASFPGELWQPTVPEGLPKHGYFQRKPHTQNRTRFYQGLSEAYPSSDQIQGTQAHHHLPGRRCLSQWCAVVFVAYFPPQNHSPPS